MGEQFIHKFYLVFFFEKNSCLNEKIINAFTFANVEELSLFIYLEYGNYKKYKENLLNILYYHIPEILKSYKGKFNRFFMIKKLFMLQVYCVLLIIFLTCIYF